MKYTRKKLSVEVNDWVNDRSEYLRILAFVHDVFKNIDHEINVDIPPPVVKLTQFHFNTKRYTFCVDNPEVIYLSDQDKGKALHAALITSIISYYSKNLYPADSNKAMEATDLALDELEVILTLTEVATTSTIIITGLLVGKSILSKIF